MSRVHYLKCSCQQCGEHIEFPEDGLGMTILCPHCGNQTRLVAEKVPVSPQKKILLTISILAIVCVLATAGAVLYLSKKLTTESPGSSTTPASTATTESPSPAPLPPGFTVMNDFQVSKVTLKKTEGTSLVYAMGTVKNDTNRQRFGVKVQLDLLDDQDQKIGSTSDYIQVMEPRKEWRFRALLTNPKAASARLVAVEEQK